jgi:hypothetical protein
MLTTRLNTRGIQTQTYIIINELTRENLTNIYGVWKLLTLDERVSWG